LRFYSPRPISNGMDFIDFKTEFGKNLLIFFLIILWTLFWKGYSLWTSAQNKQKGWFIALLIINTFGILDIIYIFFVAKKTWRDILALFHRQSEIPKKEGSDQEKLL